MNIPSEEEIVNKAYDMLVELESMQLEVTLRKAPIQNHSGHKIRAAQMSNCDWYRKYCAMYVSRPEDNINARRRRKPQTIIRRRVVIRSLELIVAGKPTRNGRLRDFIITELENELNELEDFFGEME